MHVRWIRGMVNMRDAPFHWESRGRVVYDITVQSPYSWDGRICMVPVSFKLSGAGREGGRESAALTTLGGSRSCSGRERCVWLDECAGR